MGYNLIIFDLYGTLTNTPFIDKKPLALVPGRKEQIKELLDQGITLAIAHNAGGVAFGIQSEQEAMAEVADIARDLGIGYCEVSFAHPSPKANEKYRTSEALAMRKPAPGMINKLMHLAGASPENTLVVGDLQDDKGAAENAHCQFRWAHEFFDSIDRFALSGDQRDLVVRFHNQLVAFVQMQVNTFTTQYPDIALSWTLNIDGKLRRSKEIALPTAAPAPGATEELPPDTTTDEHPF